MRFNLKHLFRQFTLAAMLLTGCGAASAGVIHVTINTANFGVASGYLDMQLSASANVPLATVVVSNMVGFSSGGFVDSWGVTTIPGGYSFRNDTSNDLYRAVNFGGLLKFDLTFAGAIDPLTKYVSHFVIGAYNLNDAPLGTFNPLTGALADFSWTPATTAQKDGSIGIRISDANVSAVPEPAAWLLMLGGLLAFLATRAVRASAANRE